MAGKHIEVIKAQIRMKEGKTLRDLSQEWGFHYSAISTALRRPWPALQQKVAAYLECRPEALWPDRYDRNGRILPTSQILTKNSSSASERKVQKRKVA